MSAGRQAARKEHQFCRQVQRALNLALADSAAGTGLADLFVEAVSPAPDCSRLLAYVVVPHEWPIAEALNALNRDAARLRTEVAMAIARKRAPELTFVPAVSEEAWNDIDE